VARRLTRREDYGLGVRSADIGETGRRAAVIVHEPSDDTITAAWAAVYRKRLGADRSLRPPRAGGGHARVRAA
jgi:hypothetical protein